MEDFEAHIINTSSAGARKVRGAAGIHRGAAAARTKFPSGLFLLMPKKVNNLARQIPARSGRIRNPGATRNSGPRVRRARTKRPSVEDGRGLLWSGPALVTHLGEYCTLCVVPSLLASCQPGQVTVSRAPVQYTDLPQLGQRQMATNRLCPILSCASASRGCMGWPQQCGTSPGRRRTRDNASGLGLNASAA